MSFVKASYDQVASTGFISVRPLNDYASHKKPVLKKFYEEKVNLARHMATTRVNGIKNINYPLMSALITAFRQVECAVVTTEDQISSRKHRPETLVFVLRDPMAPPIGRWVEKPHKGSIVLCRDEESELYVPVPLDRSRENAAFIPLNLTDENVGNVCGRVGRNLEIAFRDGQKDLLRNDTEPKRIKCERAIEELAAEDIASYYQSLTLEPCANN